MKWYKSSISNAGSNKILYFSPIFTCKVKKHKLFSRSCFFMTKFLLELLRCPITRSPLKLEEISVSTKKFHGGEERITERAILYADEDWFIP